MFDKFGEFDSVEEINRAAAAQLAQGDTEAIIAIALENGIDKEDAEDYIDGCMDELVTPLMAAVGKLEVEAKELKLEGMMADWKNIIVQQCTDNQQLSIAVRRKGKSLEKCLGKILKYAFEKKTRLNDKIVKAAELRPPIYLGIPGNAELKKLINDYYLGGKS